MARTVLGVVPDTSNEAEMFHSDTAALLRSFVADQRGATMIEYLLSPFVHLVDDDVWRFDQFAGAAHLAGPAHLCQTYRGQLPYPLPKAPHNLGRGAWIVFLDPIENFFEIGCRSCANKKLHRSRRRKRMSSEPLAK